MLLNHNSQKILRKMAAAGISQIGNHSLEDWLSNLKHLPSVIPATSITSFWESITIIPNSCWMWHRRFYDCKVAHALLEPHELAFIITRGTALCRQKTNNGNTEICPNYTPQYGTAGPCCCLGVIAPITSFNESYEYLLKTNTHVVFQHCRNIICCNPEDIKVVSKSPEVERQLPSTKQRRMSITKHRRDIAKIRHQDARIENKSLDCSLIELKEVYEELKAFAFTVPGPYKDSNCLIVDNINLQNKKRVGNELLTIKQIAWMVQNNQLLEKRIRVKAMCLQNSCIQLGHIQVVNRRHHTAIMSQLRHSMIAPINYQLLIDNIPILTFGEAEITENYIIIMLMNPSEFYSTPTSSFKLKFTCQHNSRITIVCRYLDLKINKLYLTQLGSTSTGGCGCGLIPDKPTPSIPKTSQTLEENDSMIIDICKLFIDGVEWPCSGGDAFDNRTASFNIFTKEDNFPDKEALSKAQITGEGKCRHQNLYKFDSLQFANISSRHLQVYILKPPTSDVDCSCKDNK